MDQLRIEVIDRAFFVALLLQSGEPQVRIDRIQERTRWNDVNAIGFERNRRAHLLYGNIRIRLDQFRQVAVMAG